MTLRLCHNVCFYVTWPMTESEGEFVLFTSQTSLLVLKLVQGMNQNEVNSSNSTLGSLRNDDADCIDDATKQ